MRRTLKFDMTYINATAMPYVSFLLLIEVVEPEACMRGMYLTI